MIVLSLREPLQSEATSEGSSLNLKVEKYATALTSCFNRPLDASEFCEGQKTSF